jgi:hypothetical protein
MLPIALGAGAGSRAARFAEWFRSWRKAHHLALPGEVGATEAAIRQEQERRRAASWPHNMPTWEDFPPATRPYKK